MHGRSFVNVVGKVEAAMMQIFLHIYMTSDMSVGMETKLACIDYHLRLFRQSFAACVIALWALHH